jgi:hypothetical protein
MIMRPSRWHPSPYPLPQGKGVKKRNLTPFPDGEAVEREGVGGGAIVGLGSGPVSEAAR